jgi:hypothetical protein
MGPSLRVRPHRPTYMRLQKDHQKPAKKKRRRRREMPRHPAPPTSRVGRVSALFRPTHTGTPPPTLSYAEFYTLSAACRACLSGPPSPAARFPTRLLQKPNLVIRETIPTQNIQSDERDCPGLRVGPAHVVAHRLSLP